MALKKVNARYYMLTVALKTSFGAGTNSVWIDNAVLGTLSIHLLFTIPRNVDFTGPRTLAPYSSGISV
jgi:hypothetical protein